MCNLVNITGIDQRYLDLIASPAFDRSESFSEWFASPERDAILKDRVSAFARPLIPILALDAAGTIASHQNPRFDLASWSLIPPHVRSEAEAADFVKRYYTYNARSEGMAERPTWRDAVRARRRCVVPVVGFYEWQHVDTDGRPDPGGRKTVRHFIYRADGRLLLLGGLYGEWQGRTTFSVITTASNALMTEIHNTKQRQPLFLDDTELDEFLGAESIERFCVPREDIPLESVTEVGQKSASTPTGGGQLDLF